MRKSDVSTALLLGAAGTLELPDSPASLPPSSVTSERREGCEGEARRLAAILAAAREERRRLRLAVALIIAAEVTSPLEGRLCAERRERTKVRFDKNVSDVFPLVCS